MSIYKLKNITELINLYKSGDKKALNEIIMRYKDIIYDTFNELGNINDSADLTQEALLKMSKSLKNLESPEKFEVWLKKIIRNLFYDSLRQKNRLNKKKFSVINPININFDECIIDPNKTPDENYQVCELKNKIKKAIDNLSPLLKSIVYFREIEGLSYEEISIITNLKLSTVKTRLARARIKLRKELHEYIVDK